MTTEEYHQLVYNFRIKRPLPLYDLPRPPGLFTASEISGADVDPIVPKSETQCCVIFPIFKAYDEMITPPHYIINSAFWAAHAWRVNTDCVEKGWDIFFLVDRELWENAAVREQFQTANLTDFVILFDMLPGRVIRHKLGAKLYATTVPAFRWYYRCYLWDTDNFVSIRDPNHILETDNLLDIGADESLVNTLFYNGPHPRTRPVWREKYEKDTDEYSLPIYDSYLEAYLGYVPDSGFGVSGQLYVWNAKLLRQDFKDMVLELTPNISDDEDQYAAYLQKTGVRPMPLQDIWYIPMYFESDRYFQNDPYYFDHVWLNRNEADGQAWMEQCTKGEVDGITAYNDPAFKDIWIENIGLNRRLPQ